MIARFPDTLDSLHFQNACRFSGTDWLLPLGS
jgi:hypothetical protein